MRTVGARTPRSDSLIAPGQLPRAGPAERKGLVDRLDNQHSGERLLGIQTSVADQFVFLSAGQESFDRGGGYGLCVNNQVH
jgi:hypothetical protein